MRTLSGKQFRQHRSSGCQRQSGNSPYGKQLTDLNADTVDLHAVSGADEDVFYPVKDARFDQVCPLGIDADGHVGRLQLELAGIDDRVGAKHSAGAEGLVELRAERGDALLGHAAGGQHLGHGLLGDGDFASLLLRIGRKHCQPSAEG